MAHNSRQTEAAKQPSGSAHSKADPSPERRTVSWGVLGTAGIARSCMIPGLLLSQSSSLCAIAGRDPRKAWEFQKEFGFRKSYTGYDLLLQDPEIEAVYVPLPNSLHREWVIRALRAGKHVLCEKPLALSAAEAQEMYDTARGEGRLLMEAFAYLHTPYIASLKKDVSSGLIGEPDYVETAFLTQSYREDIRLHRETGGGAMYDLGCYCTSMILSLIDSKPVLVKAAADFSEEGVDLLTAGIMKFENGARASFNAGMNLGYAGARHDRLYVHGSLGCIRSDIPYNHGGKAQYTVETGDEVIIREFDIPHNYALEAEHF